MLMLQKTFASSEAETRFSVDGAACTAKSAIKKGDVLCSIPVGLCLTPDKARATLEQALGRTLPQLRTGDLGLLALLLLYEKSLGKASKYDLYIRSLPGEAPGVLGWSQEELEELVVSSTRNFKAQLDAVEDDCRLLTSSPKLSSLATGETFKWAVGIVKSRQVFLEGSATLVPLIDSLPFDPFSSAEPFVTGAGVFGGKVVKVKADVNIDAGQPVFVSFGLKGSAECVEDHGFCPELSLEDSCAEFQVALDKETDRWFDDKVNVLEQVGLSPSSIRFDIEADPTAPLDRELLQVVRLKVLDGTDSFILEPVFANTVWQTLQLPFSKINEVKVFNFIKEKLGQGLAKLDAKFTSEQDAIVMAGGDDVDRRVTMARLRVQERSALSGAIAGIEASLRILGSAADSNIYYQERRLRELDLLRPLDDDEIVQ